MRFHLNAILRLRGAALPKTGTLQFSDEIILPRSSHSCFTEHLIPSSPHMWAGLASPNLSCLFCTASQFWCIPLRWKFFFCWRQHTEFVESWTTYCGHQSVWKEFTFHYTNAKPLVEIWVIHPSNNCPPGHFEKNFQSQPKETNQNTMEVNIDMTGLSVPCRLDKCARCFKQQTDYVAIHTLPSGHAVLRCENR